MTLNEALQRVMTDRPGEATEAELEKWVNDLEVRWQQEQIDTHWPTFAEIAAAQAEAQAEEAEEEAIDTPSQIDTSAYGAGTNPSEMGWWVDDPEDIAGYYKIPTTDTSIVNGRQYFGKPPVEMVSPAYMSVWEAQADEEEAEEEEEPSLLIQPPDDEVYIYWLYSKIDMRLGEIARYNNDAMMFNAAWSEAAKRYNRTHMPKGRNLRHVVYGKFPVPRPPVDDPLNQRVDPFRWR